MVDPKIKQILDVVLVHTKKVINNIDYLYVALYNRKTVELDFPLVARKSNGRLERLEIEKEQGDEKRRWVSRAYQPSNLMPDCIFSDAKSVLIEKNFEKWLTNHQVKYHSDMRPLSWLGVPLKARGRAVGAIIIENCEREHAYDTQTRTILSAIANRAAGTLANARLVKSLRAVNKVGQELTSGISLERDEIWTLIYEQAGQLMDTRNMYVALYDEEQQMLDFPLATYKGEFTEFPARKAEIRDETKGGLTEAVLRTKKTLCPPNVQNWYNQRNLRPPVLPVPKSWLGVPMMVGEKVIGIIALQNDDVESLYGSDDQAVLQTMADLAAVAIENANLYSAVIAQQARIANAENLLVRHQVASDLVHRLNNMLGTIPVRIALIKESLDDPNSRDRIMQHLEGTADDAKRVMLEAKQLQLVPEPEVIDDLCVMIEAVLEEASLATSRPITKTLRCARDLLAIRAIRIDLTNALRFVIDNAVEALEEEGEELTIQVRQNDLKDGRQEIEIRISDDGSPIPTEIREKIFQPGTTSKVDGTGYGLWRARNLVESMGGRLILESALSSEKTKTFSFHIPVSHNRDSR